MDWKQDSYFVTANQENHVLFSRKKRYMHLHGLPLAHEEIAESIGELPNAQSCLADLIVQFWKETVGSAWLK